MKNRKQLKDAVHDRREFLLKSASVAGAISTPTLIGLGLLPTSGHATANSDNKKRWNAKDDLAFYDLTITAGWDAWDYAEAIWTDSTDGTTRSGTLIFYAKYWWPFNIISETANYSFSYKKIMVGNGYDLDSVTGLSIIQNKKVMGITRKIPLPDESEHYDGNELRRKLQDEPDWGEDWQIPASWQREFSYWNSMFQGGDPSRPLFGVYVHQWGGRQFDVAVRILFVYQFEYDVRLGVVVRRATPRRVMYLFGAVIQGRWANLAMDQIEDGARPHLNRLRNAIFRAAYMDVDFDGNEDREIPFYGWRNDVAGQRNLARRLVGAIVGELAGGAPALGMAARAIEEAQQGWVQLRDQNPPLVDGFYNVAPPVAPWPVPPLRYRGVQANNNGNFGVVNVAINNVNWLDVYPGIGWRRFRYVPNPVEPVPIPQLQFENAWPAVLPDDIDNGTVSTAPTTEDSFNSAIDLELGVNPHPHSSSGRWFRALVSDF